MKIILLLVASATLAGCMGFNDALKEADYACSKFILDGPTTDSSASAIAIKVPDGVAVTDALLANICPE